MSYVMANRGTVSRMMMWCVIPLLSHWSDLLVGFEAQLREILLPMNAATPSILVTWMDLGEFMGN